MKNKTFILIFSFIFLLALGSFEQVLACQNSVDEELCGKIGWAESVFVGQVKSPNPINNNYYDEVVFDVKENIFGADEKTYSILWGISNDKCGYLESGKSYLIFARGDVWIYKNDVKIPVKQCIQIEKLEKAQTSLEVLRSFVKNASGATISGKMYSQRDVGNIKNPLANKPMPGIKLEIASSDGGNFKSEIVTGFNGEYEFKNLPVGKYKITPTLPEFFELRPFMTGTVSVKKNFGCLFASFEAENSSEISGKVLDSNGKAINELDVEIIPLDKNSKPLVTIKKPSGFEIERTREAEELNKIVTENSYTEEDGEFSFSSLPVGKYVLAVSFKYAPDVDSPYSTTFYPNSKTFSEAQIFDIEPGTKINNLVFQLPQKLVPVEIKGKIVLKNGKIPDNISVSLRDLATNQYFDGDLDADGNFTLQGFEGRNYQITAHSYWTSDTLDTEETVYNAASPNFLLKRNPSFYNLNLKKRSLK